VLGLLYLNIIILNLVIALVGDVYDAVMAVRKETELKLKAEMLKEIYDFKSFFSSIFPQNEEIGYLYVLRLVDGTTEQDDGWLGKVNSIIEKTKDNIR
jgi:hypothetical protein